MSSFNQCLGRFCRSRCLLGHCRTRDEKGGCYHDCRKQDWLSSRKRFIKLKNKLFKNKGIKPTEEQLMYIGSVYTPPPEQRNKILNDYRDKYTYLLRAKDVFIPRRDQFKNHTYHKSLVKRGWNVYFKFAEIPKITNDLWVVTLKDDNGQRSGNVDAPGSVTITF